MSTVEDRLTRLETLMGHAATREDLEKAKNSILRWLVSTLLISVGAWVAVLQVLTK